ncbi:MULTISPECIES: hypothetical protein [unclassified Streptomyces]|uniref:hypothetical protein n=1 Tax=unclassified Streptomyces TaxID=2593676 RepID=UPI0022528B4A|nr:hypothetical protein [Streptomyces sp. NBC_00047]MCX5613198.1 hypothetical protein [Streptomyces sp. NBC_00047]
MMCGLGVDEALPCEPVGRLIAVADADDECSGGPEWARLFAQHPDAWHRAKPAACPGLPADARETLAADPDVRVVALSDHDRQVVEAAAANPSLPTAVMAELAGSAPIGAAK